MREHGRGWKQAEAHGSGEAEPVRELLAVYAQHGRHHTVEVRNGASLPLLLDFGFFTERSIPTMFRRKIGVRTIAGSGRVSIPILLMK